MTDSFIVTTLRKSAALLNKTDIPYALTGSCAVYARGGALISEHDSDFLIQEHDSQRVLDLFAENGYRTLVPPEGWLVKAFDGGSLVDFIFRAASGPVTMEDLNDVDVLRVFSVPMPVLSATKLMVHKLLALDVHSCDLAPLLLMARVLAPEVDWARVRESVYPSPYAAAFLMLSDRLGVSK